MPSQGSSQVNLCIKYVLFIINFFMWVLAIGCIGFGVYSELQKKSTVGNVLDIVLNPAFLIIAVGCIVFLTTFFGCIGALRDNVPLLRAYYVMLTVVLILELLLVVIIVIFFFVPQVFEKLSFLDPTPVLEEAIERYKDDPDLGDTIDEMQRGLKCCGASNNDEGYKDWDKNLYYNCTTNSPSVEACGVPSSCCKVENTEVENTQCGYNVRSSGNSIGDIQAKIYTQGCLKGLGQFIQDELFLLIGLGAGVIIPQIVCISLAKTMVNQIRQQRAINKRNEARNY